MRARKPRHTQERLVRYSNLIVEDPQALRGSWKQSRCPRADKVSLDLGCGKGAFVIGCAQRDHDTLYIGLDNERICIAMAAEKVSDSGLDNVALTIAEAKDLEDIFAPQELDSIHLNFSTPLPKAKHAKNRLTFASKLMVYRNLLKPDGILYIKTDSQPMFDFTLTQLELTNFEIDWMSRDLRSLDSGPMADDPLTDFEQRLIEKGAKIHALKAHMGPAPQSLEQTAPMGLTAYLPQDLDSMEYVPFGMEDTVSNMRNRRAKEAAKEARKQASEHEDQSIG